MTSPESAPGANRRRLPRFTITEAIRRYWFIAVLPAIVLVAAGAGLAVSRDPVYTAETRMQVGNIDLSQPGALSSFVNSNDELADSFSRAVDADAVVEPVAKALEVQPSWARAHVSATPVPNTPVFRVIAKTPSADSAMRLANLAARHLRRYSAELYQPRDRTAQLYRAYKRAALDYSRLLDRRLNIDRRADPEAYVAAEAAARSANTRATALRQNYYQSAAAQNSAPATAQVLTKATGASSDRMQVLQLYVFIGLVGGALAGAALAHMVANRAVRRSLATL